MEQVFNFKLTRLGAHAVGTQIGKTDGWLGVQLVSQSQPGQREWRGGGRARQEPQAAPRLRAKGLSVL